MIAFGVCIGSEDKYLRFAARGIQACAEPDSVVMESTDNTSIFAAYNEMLDAVRDRDDLEALVLLHEDVELRDPRLPALVRRWITEEGADVVGAVGAREVRQAAWWEGTGVGRCHETRGLVDFGVTDVDADVVDGLLMVLSPWAVRNVRFDDATFSGFHAYDVDYCLQVGAAGRRVAVRDVDLFHHTKGGFGDEVSFRLADAALREKWDFPSARVPGLPACPSCGAGFVAGPGAGEAAVALCPTCGTGVTCPLPERVAASDGIWSEQYGGRRLQMRPQWVHEARQRVHWLQLHVPDGRLLEVGSGTGEFVAVAAEEGYDAWGVEPSPWAAGEARDFGARVMNGLLADWIAGGEEPVDAVVAFHVVEHLHDPVGFLREARDCLRPRGVLALEVPNFDSALARRATMQWVSPVLRDHVFHYTPEGLRRLVESVGFDVVGTLEFSTRVYESGESWRQNREMWRQLGLSEPPLEMLRLVATVRPA